MSVGSYLRAARERHGLTLDEISRSTKIKLVLLVDLENNDLRRWPKPYIYRQGHLRAYARAVGLDPMEVLDRFDDEFGDPHPVAFHGRPRKPAALLPFRFLRYAVLLASLLIVMGAAVGVFEPPHDAPPSVTQWVAPQIRSNDYSYGSATSVPTLAPSPITASPVAEESEIEEGELRISSYPLHAHVTVNGNGYGPTPLRVRYLPLTSYTIRVIQTGYRIGETRVTLSREQPIRTVRMVLRDAPTFPSPTFDTFGWQQHSVGPDP
jgi:cytoskeletal protein RodZ